MIFEPLLDFFVVILVQFLFFLFHAYKVGELQRMKEYLIRGMILGLPTGIIFDLTFGYAMGLWDYTLGFTWWFLIINGIFSYGFMIANIFLLYHHSLKHMYLWSIGLALVYEVVNYFFPVWEWTFATNPLNEYFLVTFALYAVFTVVIMIVMRLLYRTHFRLLPF